MPTTSDAPTSRPTRKGISPCGRLRPPDAITRTPDLVLFCDLSNTLAPPSTLRDFLKWKANIDRSTLKDMAHGEQGVECDSSIRSVGLCTDSQRRGAELRYMYELMWSRRPVDTLQRTPAGFAKRPLEFSVADMERFGSERASLYHGVVTSLHGLKRYTRERLGLELAIAVVTNTPEPIIRKTALMTTGAVDLLEGQSYKDREQADGAVLACADGEHVGSDTKPSRVKAILDNYGLGVNRAIFMGDGFSDEPAMEFVSKGGGAIICVRMAETIDREYNGLPLTKKQMQRDLHDTAAHKLMRAEMASTGALFRVVTGNYAQINGHVSSAERQIRRVISEQARRISLSGPPSLQISPGLDHGALAG